MVIKRKKTRSLVLNLSSSGASLTFRWRSQCAIGKRSLEPGKEWEVGTTRTGLMAEQERTCWSRERCTGKPDSWATETFKDCYWDETASCWRNGQWDVREKVENIFSKIGGKLFSKGTLQQGYGSELFNTLPIFLTLPFIQSWSKFQTVFKNFLAEFRPSCPWGVACSLEHLPLPSLPSLSLFSTPLSGLISE